MIPEYRTVNTKFYLDITSWQQAEQNPNKNEMKKITLIIILIFSQHIYSQTQQEMSEKEKINYNISENELNIVYNQILEQNKINSDFLKKFKKTQRTWNTLKKLEVDLKYPKTKRYEYGSVFSMCKWIYLTDINKKRIKELKTWLKKTEEGNVCN